MKESNYTKGTIVPIYKLWFSEKEEIGKAQLVKLIDIFGVAERWEVKFTGEKTKSLVWLRHQEKSSDKH